MTKNKPLVSITIPTWNSARTLVKTMKSIKSQTYKNIEIIVADGESTDKTREIAKKYGAKLCFGRELARARFEALKKSKGKYILALDSDQFITRDLIERCVKKIEDEKLDALILYEESIVKNNTLIEKLLSRDKWAVVTSYDKDPMFGATIPRFFRRSKLIKMKWPKKVSILDDAILFQKNLKDFKKVGFIREKCISHYEVTSMKVFFKKFTRYGRLYVSTLKESPETVMAHSIPRRAYLRREILLNPTMVLSLSLLYGIKATAVLTGIVLELKDQLLVKLSPRKRLNKSLVK